MKTYEEMARDVLRRRDEEILQTQQTSQINPPPEVVYPGVRKKRSWIPKIAIPCAAAVLVGTVGLTVWKNTIGSRNPGMAASEGADDDTSKIQYIFNEFTNRDIAAEEIESIYKGGKTEININEAEEWLVYHLPALIEEDFRPIDDDKINQYYGFEFDRLSSSFPVWKSEHTPFGAYEHDEDDGFVVSHGFIYSTNVIHYTFDTSLVAVSARITPRYDSASVENAKPSVINGFDAMVYSCVGELNDIQYAADIEMGIAQVTIYAQGVSEDEFLNILDVYTAPDKNVDIDYNQTMEDKINILDEPPEFINDNSWPFFLETDENVGEDDTFIRYSMSELNDFYGINIGCLSELHPDWVKKYTEKDLGIYVHDFDDIQTDNMAVSGGRAIVWTKNKLDYNTTENCAISTSVMRHTLSEEEIGSSVVNGYNAVIFQKIGNDGDVSGYGAAIQMDGTLVFITSANQSEDEFIDLVREYATEASKFVKSSNPAPTPVENKSTTFKACDFVDCDILYDVNWNDDTFWWDRTIRGNEDHHDTLKTQDNITSLEYLQEFFNTDTDELPVDKQYIYEFKRYTRDGHFTCLTAKGAKAYTPVNGRVVAVCDGRYNGGLGNAVAVEFGVEYGDYKYFIVGHLEEVNVEVGDELKPGDVLGVCGTTGAVFVEEDDEALLSLITLTKYGS